MLKETDPKAFHSAFPSDPHQFVSEGFIALNAKKVDRVIRLMEDEKKPRMGIVAGIRDNKLQSPFSAPFGGFHFRKDIMYASEIEAFLEGLKQYIVENKLDGIELTLPPNIYNMTFNAKVINALIRSGFHQYLPDVTSWVELEAFEERFKQKNSREYYRQSVRNNLVFEQTDEDSEKESIYEIIRKNRESFGRPIYMTYNDIEDTAKLWPVDYFRVTTEDSNIVASGIFYRCHKEIVFPLFWGDIEAGRPLRAMDFLAFNLWSHYKQLGYKYIDLGISTEDGIPNEGLLRFKESHEAISSLRFSFHWKP